jgi:hypothetical protein
MFHCSVRTLQEPGQYNVVSLPARAEVGQKLAFDETTGDEYEVSWCDEPYKDTFDAAMNADKGIANLRPPSHPRYQVARVYRAISQVIVGSSSPFFRHFQSNKNGSGLSFD